MRRERLASALALTLTLAGLTVSAWLWSRYADPAAATCGTAGCDAVRASAFASWGPVSTPALGVVAFGLFAAAQLVPRLRRWASGLGVAAIVAGSGFLALQAWVIDAWCPWCVAADVSAISAGLLVWQSRRAPPPASRATVLASVTGVSVPLAIALSLPNATPPAPSVTPAAVTADGTLTIVEFVDFECPFCRRQHAQLSQLLASYGDRVQVQRRHLPLPTHPHAQDAARVACCAEEQELGDAVADALMTTEDLSLPGCMRCAESAGAALGPLSKCLDSDRPDARLAADKAEADRVGIRRLPTCIVDGQAYEGLQDPATLRAAIDAALNPT